MTFSKHNESSLIYHKKIYLDGYDKNSSQMKELQNKILEIPFVKKVQNIQHKDGSWGQNSNASRRILDTIWVLKILTDLGLDRDICPQIETSAKFLYKNSMFSGGVSPYGENDNVLSCYTGIVANALIKAGIFDIAEESINWIINYQEVKFKNRNYNKNKTTLWHESIRTKYGGCMSNTTCLIGLVKVGHALSDYCLLKKDKKAEKTLHAIAALLLDREIIFRSDLKTVLDLSKDWTKPAFPLDYRTDLIEVLDLIGKTTGPTKKADHAIELLNRYSIADNEWPLLKTYHHNLWYLPERENPTKKSEWVTLRAQIALKKLID